MGDLSTFVELRPLLFAVAYRMLGSATEADDVLQDAYLRWREVDDTQVASPRSYLTSVVVRLSIDTLRSARWKREQYVGPWLPEPILGEALSTSPAAPDDPSHAAELSDSVSLAFLVLLEELTPVERAVFLLHEVFGYPFSDVASMVGKSEANCRQLATRARGHVAARRARFDADAERGRQLTEEFLTAARDGDLQGLLKLLTEDAVLWSDGGGKVQAARRPIAGAEKVGRFVIAIAAKGVGTYDVELTEVNGQPGASFSRDGAVHYVLALDILGGRVAGVRLVANPDKLAHLSP